MNPPSFHIAVLGAGPAGATAAIGLARLGYRVTVITVPRRVDTLEGISKRVLEGLESAGLNRALATVGAVSARRVEWGDSGPQAAVNSEHLLAREDFDHALLEDLADNDIDVVVAQVRSATQCDTGWEIRVEPEQQVLTADFVVEARGRQAPLASGRLRGPESVSLQIYWRGKAGEPLGAVESGTDGWVWMARLGDGRTSWQQMIDPSVTTLPAREHLREWCVQRCARRFAESPLVRSVCRELPASSQVDFVARASTTIMRSVLGGPRYLCIGDAALAGDPLSGNGIFLALSTALQTPAVVNTLLCAPERAALALEFHRHRIEQLGLRFVRTGRDFYAMEQRWPDNAFWAQRRIWPDSEPLHPEADFSALRVERAAVVCDGMIVEREVGITPLTPLGVWHVDGVEIAPLLTRVRDGAPLLPLLSGVPRQTRQRIYGWFRAQGWPGEEAELENI